MKNENIYYSSPFMRQTTTNKTNIDIIEVTLKYRLASLTSPSPMHYPTRVQEAA
jgi:hypothetical protein